MEKVRETLTLVLEEGEEELGVCFARHPNNDQLDIMINWLKTLKKDTDEAPY